VHKIHSLHHDSILHHSLHQHMSNLHLNMGDVQLRLTHIYYDIYHCNSWSRDSMNKMNRMNTRSTWGLSKLMSYNLVHMSKYLMKMKKTMMMRRSLRNILDVLDILVNNLKRNCKPNLNRNWTMSYNYYNYCYC